MEVDRKWRGIGMIPMSGWGLRPEFDEFNAEKRFNVGTIHTKIAALYRRSNFTRLEETARLPRVWKAMHTGKSAGRDDGFLGRRMCGILSVWKNAGTYWKVRKENKA